MAKKKARTKKLAIRAEAQWVKVVDSQRRKIAKNQDYRLQSPHLGTISRRQVPYSDIKGIYTRLWPLVSPQSFKRYVLPAYMAVPDIDRSIEAWQQDRELTPGEWPRLYVVATYSYECLDKDRAPEEEERPVTSAMHGFRTLKEDLLFQLDEQNKPYLKPRLRDLDDEYDPDPDEPGPGIRSEYKVETLADMLGGVGYVPEEKGPVVTKVVEKDYFFLIPAQAIEAYNAILAKAQKDKKKLTGIELRKSALEILARHSVVCYPTFCALTGDNKITIQAFRQMLKVNGYHRTGTVGKTAIFRPWTDMYPEGVPEHVLGKEAGDVPA